VNKQGTSSMVKKQPMVKSDTNACAKINENANAERKLSMREKLEKWREEKGKNKPESVNPLLSRKRPLVSWDAKQNVAKKVKVTAPPKAQNSINIRKKTSDVRGVGKGHAFGVKSREVLSHPKKMGVVKLPKSKGKNEVQCEKRETSKMREVEDTANLKTGSVTASKTTAETKAAVDDKSNCSISEPIEKPALAAIEEDNEGERAHQLDESKMHVREETAHSSSSVSKAVAGQDEMKAPIANSERFASFSVCQAPKQRSSKKETRRKTVCFTPSEKFKSNERKCVTPGHRSFHLPSPAISCINRTRPSYQKTPLRAGMLHMPPNSAPHQRSDSVRGQRVAGDVQRKSVGTPMLQNPFKKLKESLPQDSVVRSAPRRPISSAKRPDKLRGASAEDLKQKQAPTTPFKSVLSKCSTNSLQRSAPVRRSMPHRQKTPVIATEGTSKTPSSNVQRRKTINFTPKAADITPVCQPPFTPRGEWQNKELSIRERLDMWLAHKGNTIKKPFVTIRKTPAKRRRSNAPYNDEEVALNTTFTLESDDENEADDDVRRIEKKIPQMNDLEKSVVEESLQELMERVNKPSEIDTVQEELDLILSTSPGVVRLASFWIVRSRLAAIKDNVDRVICLLEQANAFDAQPQSIIRDEICKYLEQLKKEQLQNQTEPLPETSMNPAGDNDVAVNKALKTPSKRVTFAESQQHVVFQSSLIKFCLLECTPFRKKLKSSLGRQILTPVRRSGRIDKFESKLPPVVQSHVPTASSPRQFAENIKAGEVYFLPNLNVPSKWNEVWAYKDADDCQLNVSF